MLALFLLLQYSLPTYGVNIISGLNIVSENGNDYMWLENNTPCEINLKVWITVKQNGGGGEEKIKLANSALNKMGRIIISYPSAEAGANSTRHLNIMQKSTCNDTRLIKINL